MRSTGLTFMVGRDGKRLVLRLRCALAWPEPAEQLRTDVECQTLAWCSSGADFHQFAG